MCCVSTEICPAGTYLPSCVGFVKICKCSFDLFWSFRRAACFAYLPLTLRGNCITLWYSFDTATSRNAWTPGKLVKDTLTAQNLLQTQRVGWNTCYTLVPAVQSSSVTQIHWHTRTFRYIQTWLDTYNSTQKVLHPVCNWGNSYKKVLRLDTKMTCIGLFHKVRYLYLTLSVYLC